MKTINLSIDSGEIRSRVAMSTAYTGLKQTRGADSDGPEAYGRIATVEEDALLLSRFLSDACTRAVSRLKAFVTEALYDGLRVNLTLSVSDMYDDGLTPAVHKGFGEYLAAAVTARWMRLVQPERAPEWDTEADARLAELEVHLCHRMRPRRTVRK